MSQCETCKNGIFCPTWGDYKCAALHISHTSAMLDEHCEHYKKLTANHPDNLPECHCDDCNSREQDT